MSIEKNILDIPTVELDLNKKEIVIIDQTKLPGKIELLHLRRGEEIWEAINILRVRGAPAIGVTAAMAMYVLGDQINAIDYGEFDSKLIEIRDYLDSSRPTAVNLHWALNRVYNKVKQKTEELTDTSVGFDKGRELLIEVLKSEALAIRDEDEWACSEIGRYGLDFIKPGDGVLTHCNAGQLATYKYGTATSPIYLAHKKGYNLRVYADETRPLLQGARLTASELYSAGIDVTLLCDNMCATVMRQGLINAIFVGCDRVAANGDTANKIGTSVVATVAKRYNVPFYVCAPTSTIDMNTKDGSEIVIEERPGSEVSTMWYKEPMTMEGVRIYNPAFDVTDADLITGIITEYGVAYAPFEKSFKEIMKRKDS